MLSRLLLSVGLALSACSDGGISGGGSGVVHLDPVLGDGRSPARVLDQPARVVREWRADPKQGADGLESLAPWVWHNTLAAPGSRTEGLLLRAADYRPAEGVDHVTATLAEPLEANSINRIEIDLYHLAAGSAVLTWRSSEGERRLAPGALRVEAVSVGKREETLVFDLAGHPGWKGTIRELTLYPCWRGNQSLELSAVRLCSSGFSPGPDAGCRREASTGRGDGGLLGFAGDRRRVWPTDSGVPLFARCSVPAGGRFLGEVAWPQEESSGEVHFAVDVRRAGEGGAWGERGRLDLQAAGKPAWHPIEADLADLAGEEVELRLRAWIGGGDGLGGELVAARLWWGTPELVAAPSRAQRPAVLLVTLDTLRTDAVGAYGGAQVTPRLDALASDSLLFEDAWSACNSTLPSHTSLLTGLPVPTHGVLDNRSTLADGVPTLAQALAQAGYHTAAAVSVEHLQAAWSGLGKGFDQYLDVQPRASIDGAATTTPVLAWGREWAREGRAPVFLWLHLFDPHTPYGPPSAFLEQFAAARRAGGGRVPPMRVDPPTIGRTGYTQAGKFLEGVTNRDFARFLYEASVAYADQLLGQVLDAWEEDGRLARSVTIVVADHGESFGEQGVYYSHQLLHPEVTHVPLVVHFPGVAPRRVSARAWTPDIVLTLTRYLDLPHIQPKGRDLLSLEEDGRRVWFVHSGMDQVGCRDDDVHYWHNEREYLQLGRDRAQPAGAGFLFRYAGDPDLQHNLAEEEAELLGRYDRAREVWLEEVASGRHLRASLSQEQEQRLRGLGYGGGEENPLGEER